VLATGPIPVPEGLRLVGSDLDGTLLNAALDVGPRTRAALPRAVAAGVSFVYVTGRPPRWLRPVTEQTGVAGMAVCGNGALVVDLAAGRLVRASTIETDLAAEAVTHLRETVPGITFAVERLAPDASSLRDLGRLSIFGMELEYSPLWGRPPEAEVADVLALIGRGQVLKILAIPPRESGHDSDSLVELALGPFAQRLHVTHSGARGSLIEIMDGSVDKGVGFLEVAAELGVELACTAAVGDMPNDIPLLRAAGTGYAMANAHAMTRAAADHVLPSNEDDGVGQLLEAVVAERSARLAAGPLGGALHPQGPEERG
jgi:Cof subfamily protein (haloacid dehalogenase superfamily)